MVWSKIINLCTTAYQNLQVEKGTLQDVKRVYELSFTSIQNFLFGQDLSIENITNSQNDSKIFTHLSEFKMSKNYLLTRCELLKFSIKLKS